MELHKNNLKELIKEALAEFFDPDFTLELRPETEKLLEKSLEEKEKGKLFSFEEVFD